MSWVAAGGAHKAAAACYSLVNGVPAAAVVVRQATQVTSSGATAPAPLPSGGLPAAVRFASSQTPSKTRTTRARSATTTTAPNVVAAVEEATAGAKKRIGTKAAAAAAAAAAEAETAKNAAETKPPPKTTRRKKDAEEPAATVAETTTEKASPAAPAKKARASSAKSKTAAAKTTETAAMTTTKKKASAAAATKTTIAASTKKAAAATATVVVVEPKKKATATASAAASLSKSARFVAAPAKTGATTETPTPAAPTPQEDDINIAASQEAVLAELERLRLAAMPTKLPPAATATASIASRTTPGEGPPEKPPSIRDTSQYKEASRKWTSAMVAIPILLVTSYFLFDRLVLGNAPQDLSQYRKKLADAVDRLQTGAVVDSGASTGGNEDSQADNADSNSGGGDAPKPAS